MLQRLKTYFIAGMLVVLPAVFSVYILFILFRFADGMLGRFINNYFFKKLGFYIPGLGLILSLLIIIIAGFITTHFFRTRAKTLDKLFSNIPFLKYIYPLLKQTLEFMFSDKSQAFKKAVLVEFPRKGIWSMGFVCADSFVEAKTKTGKELENIYVPFAPNPISGNVILVAKEDIIYLDISVKEATKLIVTAGIINPGQQPSQEQVKS